jgi:hypothetical protein
MMVAGLWGRRSVALLLLILLGNVGFCLIPIDAYALHLELPPEVLAKLHKDLKVALLNEWVGEQNPSWQGDWVRPINLQRSPYVITYIETAELYAIKMYDVLVTQDYRGGSLTTEQIDMIVSFVKGGGGLIIASSPLTWKRGPFISDTARILLSKLGIEIKAGVETETKRMIIIEKDGKAMIDHPITIGVESIEVSVHNPVTYVEIDKGTIFITTPFVAVAKDYGEGRVVFLGCGDIVTEERSGLRFAVNIVEWVAGHTPPGWNPPVDSIIGSLREENDRLKKLLSERGEQRVSNDSSKAEYEKLKAKYNELEARYSSMRTDYDAITAAYNKLKTDFNSLELKYKQLESDYNDLKIKYENLNVVGTPTLMYVLLLTTIFFVATTVYLMKRKIRP